MFIYARLGFATRRIKTERKAIRCAKQRVNPVWDERHGTWLRSRNGSKLKHPAQTFDVLIATFSKDHFSKVWKADASWRPILEEYMVESLKFRRTREQAM
jgi:hypothetical protein